MSEEYGLFGKTMRAMGKYREKIGAKAIKEEMAEAKEDNNVSKGDEYRQKRQSRIDDDIRERRRKRKEKDDD